MSSELIERLASAGFRIEPEDQSRLIEAAQRARDLGITLDAALGADTELPAGKVGRRDHFLRRAFQLFRPPSDQAPARAFQERIARAHRQEFQRYQQTGTLPQDSMRACLVLALEADPKASRLSDRQIRRALDISDEKMSSRRG